MLLCVFHAGVPCLVLPQASQPLGKLFGCKTMAAFGITAKPCTDATAAAAAAIPAEAAAGDEQQQQQRLQQEQQQSEQLAAVTHEAIDSLIDFLKAKAQKP
jgi:hypothetical protein